MAPEPDYVAETLTAIHTAPDHQALNQVFAERTAALLLDHGTLAEVRTLARAWRNRRARFLTQSMDGDQP